MANEDRMQFTGDNDEALFEFARPWVFRDYTDPKVPMRLRSKSGLFKRVLTIGDWIVRQADGGFVLERNQNEVRS